MIEYKLGYFARSLCGHDKGRLYMIVREQGEMVGLCDGTHRLLSRPKMKKKRHVQIMRSESMAEAYPAMISQADADRLIRQEVRKRDKRSENKAGGL